ncbi:MAG: antibiotic biosynthesis monooxygenase [Alphaproteobacteria bacterium]|nr:antibiotic biosynthesis monooxygenase [Alphaproteobacteria bacterium]
MSDLYIVATLVAKPDQADRLREMLTGAAPDFRAEDGCMGYTVLEDAGRPGRFMTYERWRDRAAADAHMQTPLMGTLLPQLPDILAEEFKQDFLNPVVMM